MGDNEDLKGVKYCHIRRSNVGEGRKTNVSLGKRALRMEKDETTHPKNGHFVGLIPIFPRICPQTNHPFFSVTTLSRPSPGCPC